MTKIIFIQTGGTIDKDYPKTRNGYAFEISDPAVKRILQKLNPSFGFEVITALRKDSLDITDSDRKKVKALCQSLDADKIIITHGTDTMIESAKALAEISDKTIILTGSMRPEMFTNSDAPINIGIAIGAVQSLPYGVYVAMNGLIIPWEKAGRDDATDKFATTNDTNSSE